MAQPVVVVIRVGSGWIWDTGHSALSEAEFQTLTAILKDARRDWKTTGPKTFNFGVTGCCI